MEVYFKRFFIGHFLILMVAVGIGLYIGLSLITTIIFVLLLEILIYFLDVKYLSKRKTELANKLIENFKAELVSEGLMRFKIDSFDIYAEIEADFKIGLAQVANFETVKFHIPKNQIDRLSIKPRFQLKKNKINEMHTYYVYQSDGKGLKLAKEKLEKMIYAVKATANHKK